MSTDDKEYTELEMGLRAPLFALPVLPLMLLWEWPAWYRAVAVWLLASSTVYAYGWWIRENEDDSNDEPEETGMSDQSDVVEQLVRIVAPNWYKVFDRPDLVHYNDMTERLNATVRSVFVELDGNGGIQPHRLAPQGNPGIDLFDDNRAAFCNFPYLGTGPDALHTDRDALALLAAVSAARERIINGAKWDANTDPRHAVGALLTAICEIIEAGYVLVPQFYDDDGEFEEEGDDIAPGLTAAFTAEWEGASK